MYHEGLLCCFLRWRPRGLVEGDCESAVAVSVSVGGVAGPGTQRGPVVGARLSSPVGGWRPNAQRGEGAYLPIVVARVVGPPCRDCC